MRIGFDAKRAFMNSSGLGNYARTLMKSLLDHFPDNDFFAFTPGLKAELGKELLSSEKIKIVLPPQIMQGFLSSWWRSSFVAEDIRSRNLDVYHGLSNELPQRIPFSTKKIVTIHDLIFLRHPEWYPIIDRNIYYKKFRYACKHADAVVAVSEQTKKDVIYYFNIPEEKIKVIYQSCGYQFASHAADQDKKQFRERRDLPERFILYVGTIEERKNLLTLVKALIKVQDISLVVIGRKKKYFEEVNTFINAYRLQNRIIYPENVGAEELKLYYQNASVFVYPSIYEGFGIPVIEALSSGTPVITSTSSALPEAGGTGALYINPDDAEDLAQKINRVLGDTVLREKLIRDGYEHVKKFDPKDTASQMMSLYKDNKQR